MIEGSVATGKSRPVGPKFVADSSSPGNPLRRTSKRTTRISLSQPETLSTQTISHDSRWKNPSTATITGCWQPLSFQQNIQVNRCGLGNRTEVRWCLPALVAAVVDGTPTVELSGPIEVAPMRQALTEADRVEERLTGEMESVRIRLKAALRRLVAAMEFNLQNGSFNIELHGQELVCSGPDEQEYAAKCEALPLLHGGLRMPEAHLLQPLARPE